MCKATGSKSGEPCKNRSVYGVLCKSHVKMILETAGSAHRFRVLERVCLQMVTEEEQQEATWEWLMDSKNEDVILTPKKPHQLAPEVLKKLQREKVWCSVDEISGWLTEWMSREIKNRQTGMAIRKLVLDGVVEKKERSEPIEGSLHRVVTYYRALLL